MTARVDFTAYGHPVWAVACPDCRARVGVGCIRPSGHRGNFVGLHRARKEEADRVWEAQGDPVIIRTEDGKWAYAPPGTPEDRDEPRRRRKTPAPTRTPPPSPSRQGSLF